MMSGKRRLAAERAAIRQRLRDHLQRQQKEYQRQREITEKTRLWNELLPYWETVRRSARVSELCLRGIPPNIRGKVWPLLVGNSLEVTEELFESLTKEVNVLFRDKDIMTAHSRRTERMFDSPTQTRPLSHTHEDTRHSHSSHENDDGSHTHIYAEGESEDLTQSNSSRDIPIPTQPGERQVASHPHAHTHVLTQHSHIHTAHTHHPHDSHVTHIDTHTHTHHTSHTHTHTHTHSRRPSHTHDTHHTHHPHFTHQHDAHTSQPDSHRHTFSNPDAQDVTEECWFENERNGSLEQSAYPIIHRQLFGIPTHPERDSQIQRDSHSHTDIHTGKHSHIEKEIDRFSMGSRTDTGEEQLIVTPQDTPLSQSLESALPFDMSPPRVQQALLPHNHTHSTPPPKTHAPAIQTPTESHTHSHTQRSADSHHTQHTRDSQSTRTHSTERERERLSGSGSALLVPGVTSPSRLTPPHRQRHRQRFLVEAGLVKEAMSASKPRRPKPNMVNLSPDQLHKVKNAVSLIQWDLPRTFPTLAFFHDGGAMHTGLERVLLVYALFRPDIGYVQGMSFLVATLLLYMDEFEAFKCLANIMANALYTDFYGFNKPAIDAYVQCFDHYFKKFLPLLYNHFSREGVTSEMFLMDWNLSIFTKALPLEVAAHVWDMFLLEGEIFLLCVGLAILKMYAPILSTYSVEQISPFLLHLPEDIRSDELFMYIAQFNISRKGYEKIRKETRRKCEEEHAVRVAQRQMQKMSLTEQEQHSHSHAHTHTRAASSADDARRSTLTHSLRNAIRNKLSKSPSDAAQAHSGRSFSQAYVSSSHTQSNSYTQTQSSRSQSVFASSPSEDEVSRGCRQS